MSIWPSTKAKDNFNANINVIYSRIVELVGRGNKEEWPDVHHQTCSMVCDEYELWEKPVDANHSVMFPNWVMWIVSGEMREQGGGS